MSEIPARNKRIVGLTLLGSAGVMLVLAGLFFAGVIELPAETRPLLAGVLVLAAIVESMMAVRFLRG